MSLQTNLPVRGWLERFGLLAIAFGVVMSTLLAWLLTKVHASWATQYGANVPYYGSRTSDVARSLGQTTFYEHHVAAEGSFKIGIVFVVVGIVLVLVGKAVQRFETPTA